MERKRPLLLLFFLFLVIYILPLGVRPLFEPDETRYAEIPREMIASGDWVVPRLNGLRYFEKPALGYWITGASMRIFGENRFAARLPSALAAGLTALLIVFLIKRNSAGDDSTGTLSALVFLTSFEVVGVGTFLVLDSIFSLFLTGTMVCLFLALSSKSRSLGEYGYLAGAGIFCGLAFMTKGFLAFVLPGLVVSGYMVWQGRLKCLVRIIWLPLIIASLLALPWAIAIYLREPDFWNFFFWNEHIRRFMANDAQHRQSFLFFFLFAPAMFLPWTFLLPSTLSSLKKTLSATAPQINLLRFSVCWLVIPFIFFSISKGKLLTYILPCFPPLAILVGHGLVFQETKTEERRFRWGAIGATSLFAILLTVLLITQTTGIGRIRLYDSTWNWLLVAGSLIMSIMLFITSSRMRDKKWRSVIFALAPLPLLLILQFTMPDKTLEIKAADLFLESYAPKINQKTIIISDEDMIRAVCLAFKRDDVFLVGGAGELRYGIEQENPTRQLSIEQVVEMIRSQPGQIALMASMNNFSQWKTCLPKTSDIFISGHEGYVFLKY